MKKELLRDRVYREVKAAITGDGGASIQWIVENDICRNYGVSKSTAGEVLHRLAQEGLIRSYPRKGYRLSLYNQKDFVKIQRLRFVVESLALQQLCAGGHEQGLHDLMDIIADNSAFHMGLARLSEDQFICETLENLINRCECTYNSLCEENLSSEELCVRHRHILDCILRGDEQGAVEALKQDLQLNEMNVILSDTPAVRPRKKFTTDTMPLMRYLCQPSLSPDGKSALVTVYVANEEDGHFYPTVYQTDLETMEEATLSLEGHVHHAVFLKDGNGIACLCDRSGEDQLYLIDRLGKARQLTHLRHGVKGFDVSPDCTHFLVEGDLWQEEVESGIAFMEMTPEEKALWLQQREWAPIEITQIDYKRDEVKGMLDGSVRRIALVDAQGHQTILTGETPCRMPAFSPDGKAFACYCQPYSGAKRSKEEVFYFELNGQGRQLSSGTSASARPCFTPDGRTVIYPNYYAADGCSIEYLYRVDLDGGEPVCLFDPAAEEVSSGVNGSPLCRTQYGEPADYFRVTGQDEVLFLCAWQGAERLYRISTRGGSVPELVLEGNFSIHEFCAPVDGKILLTRGDTHSLRELYLFHCQDKSFVRLGSHNSWLNEYRLANISAIDVPSRDGLTNIHGWVCPPAAFEQGKKYPAVLYIHGGPTASFTEDFWHEIQILSSAGYAVVYCDPRGSWGYGLRHANEEDSWGDNAYNDLMDFLDAAIDLGFIDAQRVGVTGGSYGGYMTCKIIMRTHRFKAAVGQRIFVNSATSYGTGDIGFYSASMPYNKVNIRDCLIKRARSCVIRRMDNIQTPLLLLHGDRDYRCSFEQSEQMFISIKERLKDVPVRLVMFPGENHGVSREGLMYFQQRHVQEMVDWFDLYLKGAQHE